MFQLTNNPFEHQTTYDFDDYKSQPFILEGLDTPRILKSKLIWNASAKGQRILIKIISAKGAGKSTLSFFLQDTLLQLKNPNILIFYTNKIGIDYYELLNNLIYEFKIDTHTNEDNEKRINKFLQNKRLFLFIDFQDVLVSQSFKMLANTLERLGTLSKNISIILTMNKMHEIKMENYSYVLAKYTHFDLQLFSLDNTKNLIKERLKRVREKLYEGEEIYPFDKCFNLIYAHAGGIPRNIISACDLLLTNSEGKEINEEYAGNVLKGEFAKKVIFDMTEEGFERDYLIQLYNIIRNYFQGEISKEKELTDFLEQKLGWSNKTTSKRARKLSSFGLISITKGADLWSNTIKII